MKSSLKTGILVTFFSTLAIFGFISTASAEPGDELTDSWELIDTVKRIDLCPEGSFCIAPSMEIDLDSAVVGWGVHSGDCQAVYSARGSWTSIPATLIPGETVNTQMDAFIAETTTCGGALGVAMSVGLGIAKIIPPETVSGNIEIVSGADTGYRVESNKQYADSKSASWTVPTGEAGEKLLVRIYTGVNSLPGGTITFLYEYKSNQALDPTTAPTVAPETKQDVCAIGLVKTGWRIIPHQPVAYARDSGARFIDFSGEVTVAPGSDPSDQQPAEMDMVLETGAIIKTESDSFAIISFADMTTFCMKPFTTVILDTPPEKESKLSLLAGKVWLNVRKMIEDGSMNVTMNQAVAGIKGTVLVLEETGDQSILKVINGTVDFQSKNSSRTESVAAGEMLIADKNGLGQKTVFDINTERSDWGNFSSLGSGSEKSMRCLNFPLGIAILAVPISAVRKMIRRKGQEKDA